MPMMTTGDDKRFVADDATPCIVWPAVLATLPIVLPAVFATVLIDPVTVPTSCPGIASIPVAMFPTVPMIWDGNPKRESKNISFYVL